MPALKTKGPLDSQILAFKPQGAQAGNNEHFI